MSVFKNKLYHLITGQLPEYIVAEYPIFVDFLTAYYAFLDAESDGGDIPLPGVHHILLNTGTWQEIDLTLDLFVPEFRKQFAYDIPETALIESRRLIKYIHDYYEAKGSENAVHLFFRFMYDEEATVVYPGDYVLRASDGRWSQKHIIKVDVTGYLDKDLHELQGKTVSLKYHEDFSGAGIKERILSPIACFNVVKDHEPNIYQLEVDIDAAYEFPLTIAPDPDIESMGTYDTHVYLQYQEEVWGVLTKQLVGIDSIDIPGSAFRIDDAYEIGESGIEGKYFASDYVVHGPGWPQSAYVIEVYSNHAIIRIKDVTKVVEAGIRGKIQYI